MARLVWGDEHGHRIMITLRCAFDSSKDSPCGVTAVAGHIGRVDQWHSIEKPWNNQLAVAGVERFHLTVIKFRFRGHSWIDVVRPFAKLARQAGLRAIYSYILDTDWTNGNHDSEYRRICPHREHACLDLLSDVLAEDVHLELGDEPITIVFDNDWGNHESVV